MNQTNWKTNLAGIVQLVVSLILMFFPQATVQKVLSPQQQVGTVAVVAGLTGLAAKDHDK